MPVITPQQSMNSCFDQFGQNASVGESLSDAVGCRLHVGAEPERLDERQSPSERADQIPSDGAAV